MQSLECSLEFLSKGLHLLKIFLTEGHGSLLAIPSKGRKFCGFGWIFDRIRGRRSKINYHLYWKLNGFVVL